MINRHYEITEEQCNCTKQLIAHSKMEHTPKDAQLIVNRMLSLARSDAGCEDIYGQYHPWATVYRRFCKWGDDRTFLCIFETLNQDADMETLSLNSTNIKVENFFLKLKHFRSIATCYDKLASSFFAFIYIASIGILLK